ncbi:hypothetical protein CHS0354_027524 [Potamilus streckersoni]|uniref:Uncharacterized protein n=1 Tax=Potamilus streckersoni TaxID=2493646 RepID=A0AAE0S4U1_9BIVA|nr:hypothetical protein CHS0354_027524 [Potamilus streckersoni]
MFECDVGKLSQDQFEQLYKDTKRLRRCCEAVIDMFSKDSSTFIDSKKFRSDKISSREKLNVVKNVLQTLHLPDIVPGNVSTTTVVTLKVTVTVGGNTETYPVLVTQFVNIDQIPYNAKVIQNISSMLGWLNLATDTHQILT